MFAFVANTSYLHNKFLEILGWLGWVNCRREATKGLIMGDWAFDYFSDVSISFSSKAKEAFLSRNLILSGYGTLNGHVIRELKL